MLLEFSGNIDYFVVFMQLLNILCKLASVLLYLKTVTNSSFDFFAIAMLNIIQTY